MPSLAHAQQNMLYYGWQNETAIFMHCMRNAPQVSTLGGVSIPILRAGLNAQACCHLLSRQAICKGSGRLPLPRRREGMKQRSHSYTACTPFPCRYGDGNASSIAYFNTKRKRMNSCKKRREIKACNRYLYPITR